MSETFSVSDTLSVTAQTVCGPCVWIERDGAGLVKVQPAELVGLVEALALAAGALADDVAQRSGRDRAAMEAQRLRRRRLGAGPVGDEKRGEHG